ncbi:MAG TPA: hypothetical protein VL728_13575 [Cyclobacteriaceae bacterium]|jgi:hypothetical protein|nr:hypothetical protein [Cyclobacteriaceae bacterium]
MRAGGRQNDAKQSVTFDGAGLRDCTVDTRRYALILSMSWSHIFFSLHQRLHEKWSLLAAIANEMPNGALRSCECVNSFPEHNTETKSLDSDSVFALETKGSVLAAIYISFIFEQILYNT